MLAVALALTSACKDEDDLLENAGDASPGGAGGASGVCEYDDWRIAMAGAVHHDPQVPASGSWCPRDGIEICTDPGWNPEAAAVPDGGVVRPPGVISRCVGGAWQTVADTTCESTPHNCNVFNYREYDGKCCTYLRNCERAFCDGERWWTRRE